MKLPSNFTRTVETITVVVRPHDIRSAEAISAETSSRSRSPFSIALIQSTRFRPARLRGSVLYLKDMHDREYSCGECPDVRHYLDAWIAGQRVEPRSFVLKVKGRS